MAAFDEHLLAAELLARQGVTTLTRLERLGATRRQIDGMADRGRLRRVGNGVLVSAAWPDTLEHRAAIACAVTGGVVAFPTAGEMWGLRKTPRPPEIHLWTPYERAVIDRPGLVVKRTRELPRCDVVVRRDGIRVTSPPRTTFDGAAWLERDDLESLIEHGLWLRYYIIPTLWATARRLCRRGRPGSTLFAEVLASREAWRRPVDSDHELRLERAMRRRGFPPLTRQHALTLRDGQVIHPDLGIPEHGFFVEVDHLSWHGGRVETAYDRRRDRIVRASGFHVERVTDIDLDRRLAATIEELWTLWQQIFEAKTTA